MRSILVGAMLGALALFMCNEATRRTAPPGGDCYEYGVVTPCPSTMQGRWLYASVDLPAPAAEDDAPDIEGFLVERFGPRAAKWLVFAAFVVWLFSNISSLLNGAIAWAVDHHWQVPTWFLKVSAFINLLGNNLDKAIRFIRGYRGPAPTLATSRGK